MINRFIRFNIIIISCYALYVLCVTFIAQIIFPYQSNGSLIEKDNDVIGSSLIRQQFESDHYFQYNKKKLVNSLDPYISKANAFSQINRIAAKRNINSMRLKSLIDRYSKRNLHSKKSLVNAVELNSLLDQYFGD